MLKTTIDWGKCFQDLSGIYPDVKLELERRISQLFEGDIVQKVILGNHPPAIQVQLSLNQELPSPETQKKQVPLAVIISDVASRYKLRVFAGVYGQNSWYSLKPNYGEYEIS